MDGPLTGEPRWGCCGSDSWMVERADVSEGHDLWLRLAPHGTGPAPHRRPELGAPVLPAGLAADRADGQRGEADHRGRRGHSISATARLTASGASRHDVAFGGLAHRTEDVDVTLDIDVTFAAAPSAVGGGRRARREIAPVLAGARNAHCHGDDHRRRGAPAPPSAPNDRRRPDAREAYGSGHSAPARRAARPPAVARQPRRAADDHAAHRRAAHHLHLILR